MTNFDVFAATLQFESFASVAVSAEKILHIDPSRLRAELPQGDGVCGEVDVLCGQGTGHALSGYTGQPDEHRGLPGYRWH